jgi:acetyl esterase
MSHDTGATPLTLAQQASLAGARLFFGTFTGILRLVRGSPPDGWRTVRYGLHRDEILDIRAGNGTRRPVVFFHGGGWAMGTKDFYSHDLMFLTDAGHTVFNVEYPKAPEYPHPLPLRAVLRALAFVRGDADAVHVMGDSAGGNLAIMAGVLAQNPDLIAHVDPTFDPKTLPTILSATSIYGVLDRASCLNTKVPGGETMLEAYGGPNALRETVGPECAITPMDLAFTKHPPCLLTCGEYDPILESTQVYHKRLSDSGHEVQVKIYPGATHGYFNFPDGETKRQSAQDIVAFLNAIEA